MLFSPFFQRVSFDDLPEWNDQGHDRALNAFRLSALQAVSKPYRSASLGIPFAAFQAAYEKVRSEVPASRARDFFERHFLPCRVIPDGEVKGLVTGFYEPIVEASPFRAAGFRVPLLCRPEDLIDVEDANRPSGFDPYFAFARSTPQGLVEYYDRRSIEQGALDGKALEIAYVADPVDAFFIHVQGAARLAMTDGSVRRITYAAKSGHRFTGPGGVLADLGEIPREEVTMPSIRDWLATHRERVNEIFWRNQSYIFFREAPVEDPELGPIAAAKVPLTPGRSMAVDRRFHTFGTPLYVDAPSLTAFNGAPFRRLMVAQDTGSAIVGSARGDLFAGSGDSAGAIAGIVRHEADFFALVPVSLFGGGAA